MEIESHRALPSAFNNPLHDSDCQAPENGGAFAPSPFTSS
jgi:hypothetical protein